MNKKCFLRQIGWERRVEKKFKAQTSVKQDFVSGPRARHKFHLSEIHFFKHLFQFFSSIVPNQSFSENTFHLIILSKNRVFFLAN